MKYVINSMIYLVFFFKKKALHWLYRLQVLKCTIFPDNIRIISHVSNSPFIVFTFAGMANSGDGGALAMPKIEWKNMCKKCLSGQTVVSIRDVRNSHYLKGLAGQTRSVDKTMKYLKALSQSLCPDATPIFIGSSAGGYAALLYGCLFPSDFEKKILAFSPQVNLRIWPFLQDRRLSASKHADITSLIANADSAKVTVHIGSHNEVDVQQISPLRQLPHIKVHMHDTSSHLIAHALKAKGKLQRCLRNMVEEEHIRDRTGGRQCAARNGHTK